MIGRGGQRGGTYEVNLRSVGELLFGIATLGRIWREGALQHLTGVHDVQRNEGCGGRKKAEKRGGEEIRKKTLEPLWTRINQGFRHSLDHHDRSSGGKRISYGRVGRRDGCFCGYDEAACTRSFRD